MKLGKAILEYRAKHNLSQSSFAKICGISAQTVYSVEAGYQTPRATTLGKILSVIGGEKNDYNN